MDGMSANYAQALHDEKAVNSVNLVTLTNTRVAADDTSYRVP